jgi:CubicO group peptidase (beta-lactamase class C family)
VALGLAALIALVVVVVGVWTLVALVVYPNEYVKRVLLWRGSDVGDYLHNFPRRELTASPESFHFETALDPDRVREAFQSALGTQDLDAFLSENATQALIVVQEDRVIYQSYLNGWQRDSMLTSFSVAKSFTSTLVGIALEEGYIGSVTDPITLYLPELLERDARFERITIRDLLTMSSGLEFKESRWGLFNGDDPLTTYYPDQRQISLTNTHVVDPPNQYFLYNKYHPQLLGMILERTTGQSVTKWTQTRLWDPLGMEFDGAWCLDSTESGFEKMEAGLNARAIDYAKLGRLFLNEGRWNGDQIVPAEWVALASGADPTGRAPAFADDEYYAYMWWGYPRSQDSPDFTAEGDHGQYIYVSPAHQIIIVRNGTEYGLESREWIDAFGQVAEELDQDSVSDE